MHDGQEIRAPRRCEDLAAVGGVFRATDEDFRVDEVPLYEASGDGEHVYLHFEKRGSTTPFAVSRIARSLGVSERDVGVAGLKDRHAVTTQWISLPRVDPARVEALDVEGVRVLSVARHRNKLRTGHLAGNRFTLVVRDAGAGAVERAEAIAARAVASGVPNYFGEQRFGRDGDNAARALAWLRGGPVPRDPQQRRFLVSALQSSVFNVWLAARVRDGLLDRWVPGDLAMKGVGGRPWAIDEATAADLYPRGAASASGPMFGRSMDRPGAEAGEREDSALEAAGVRRDDFDGAGPLAEGTRRVSRLFPTEFEVSARGDDVVLAFTLPPGCYATVILAELGVDGAAGVAPAPRMEHPAPAPGGVD